MQTTAAVFLQDDEGRLWVCSDGTGAIQWRAKNALAGGKKTLGAKTIGKSTLGANR